MLRRAIDRETAQLVGVAPHGHQGRSAEAVASIAARTLRRAAEASGKDDQPIADGRIAAIDLDARDPAIGSPAIGPHRGPFRPKASAKISTLPCAVNAPPFTNRRASPATAIPAVTVPEPPEAFATRPSEPISVVEFSSASNSAFPAKASPPTTPDPPLLPADRAMRPPTIMLPVRALARRAVPPCPMPPLPNSEDPPEPNAE